MNRPVPALIARRVFKVDLAIASRASFSSLAASAFKLVADF
jgi:hypothetical protein